MAAAAALRIPEGHCPGHIALQGLAKAAGQAAAVAAGMARLEGSSE